MEVLYSAKRINNETSLRWFVYDDDQYTGYAVTNDGKRIEVDHSNIQSFYQNAINIRFSHKVDDSVISTKKKNKPTDSVNKKAIKHEPKPVKIEPVEVREDISEPDIIGSDYHKIIFSLYDEDSDFEIEVDGSENDAISLKNELSKKHQNLTIKKKIIRSVHQVIDTYTTIEHFKNGKIYFEMDFDDPKEASSMFQKRKLRYPNDDIRRYHVEEVI